MVSFNNDRVVGFSNDGTVPDSFHVYLKFFNSPFYTRLNAKWMPVS